MSGRITAIEPQARHANRFNLYVDDKFAGTWYNADQNEFLRWHDAEIDLPPELTAGKSELKVRLAVKTDKGLGPFTDFRYEVLSYAGGGRPAAKP